MPGVPDWFLSVTGPANRNYLGATRLTLSGLIRPSTTHMTHRRGHRIATPFTTLVVAPLMNENAVSLTPESVAAEHTASRDEVVKPSHTQSTLHNLALVTPHEFVWIFFSGRKGKFEGWRGRRMP